jgi:hypothetical protein
MSRSCTVLLLWASLAGGALADPSAEEAMMIRASALTKLSTAVEAAVRYDAEASAGLDAQALLAFAAGDDAALLERFAGLELRVARGDRHASVLVCSPDGGALLEDAGCTSRLDRHAWREADAAPCEFRLDLAALCGEAGALPAVNAAAEPESASRAATEAAAEAGTSTEATTEAVAEPAPASAPRPVAFASPLPLSRPPAVPLIEIARAVWAGDVDRNSKQPGPALTRSAPGRRLVLWMAVQGSAAALDQLTARGKLPIRHKWFRETLVGVRPEGVATPTDEIEIPAAQPGVVDKLRGEVAATGRFSWRTWSAKDQPGRGRWRVTVVHADNTPVLCPASGGPKACEFQIDVR